MNTDIRIETSFRGHRKRRKLHRLLGNDGIVALIDLWIGVSVSKPDGCLTGWSAEDIALEAHYSGDPDKFVEALIYSEFLDKDENGCCYLHDWIEHQPWAASFPDRKEKARRGILLRWCVDKLPKGQQDSFKDWFANEYQYNSNHNTEAILQVYDQYTKRNTPSPLPYPLPSPTPTYVSQADTLATACVDRKPGRSISAAQRRQWSGEIEKMVRIDNRVIEDIDAALSWYALHWNDNQFVPVIESGKALREKFEKLLNAIGRSKANETEVESSKYGTVGKLRA